MIYTKDNRFVVSTSPHSIGLQNDMTIAPTAGTPAMLSIMPAQKLWLIRGAITKVRNPLKSTGWGGPTSIWK